MAGWFDSALNWMDNAMYGADTLNNIQATAPVAEMTQAVSTPDLTEGLLNPNLAVDSAGGAGLFQPNMSVAPVQPVATAPAVAQDFQFPVNQPANMSVDPSLAPQTASLDINNQNSFAYGASPQTNIGGTTNVPSGYELQASRYFDNMAPVATTPEVEKGLWDSMYGGIKGAVADADLKDWGELMKGAGGLYQSYKAGQMNDEYMKTLKQNRDLAKSEQQRQKEFIDSWSKPATSNYYSA